MEYPRIFLKPRAETRVEEGHLWAFSNEIDKGEEDVVSGGLVDLYSARKKFLGRGFCNTHSLIAVRILTRKPDTIDEAFFERRVRSCLSLREEIFPGETSYRLIFGESDFLPGLVVDRYEDVLVVRSYCLGMDLLLPKILPALKGILNPKAIVKRNDSALRALEGLKEEVGLIEGDIQGPFEISQGFHGNRLKFLVDPLGGQKTGFFFDQRENRVRLTFYAKDKSVLDCFSYSGALGIYAAFAGAKSVTCIDSSQPACGLAKKNFELNGLKGDVLQADAEEALERFKSEKRKFDIIVLDPPAFAKSRKNVFSAIRKYARLNELAMSCLSTGGTLFSCSCSHHVGRQDFVKMLSSAGASAGKSPRILEMRGQARDHPVLAAMPETDYLKCVIAKADYV